MVKRVAPAPAQVRSPIIITPDYTPGYPGPVRRTPRGGAIAHLLRTTDAKAIGLLYLGTSFTYFLIGGLMALILRAELAQPGMQFLSPEQYNQLFTMHGAVMLFLFATPMVFGFGNYIVPLQIGAPDVSFPRLNALGFWLFFFGSALVMGGFLTPGGPPDFGWTAYPTLSRMEHTPGPGADLLLVGLALTGLGSILGSVNLITTIVTLRAPGMTMFRMPIFTWNMLITSLMVIIVFPVLTAALVALLADRLVGAQVYSAAHNGPILYQHLFWYFGHPEVYIIALPFFGMVTEVIPVFSRKPLFGYKGMVIATIAIFGYSLVVWAHHMYVTGQVALPFFAAGTFVIAVPTGVKFFNWIGSMWKGQITFESPMLFSIGFLLSFLIGGLSGVLLASPPLDFHTSDTYFVVAHFHYVLIGTIVFAAFAGFYFWFPKMTGRMLDERLAKVHFWTLLVGYHLTFLVFHWIGTRGMPRRYADYRPEDGFTTLHAIATIGSFVLGISTLFFIWNVWKSWRFGRVVTVRDPWGFGNSLEWITPCPPPLRNFDYMPRIRSERPAFDEKYGYLVSDLGEDVPQRATKPRQSLREELRPGDHTSPETEHPSPTGARGAAEKTGYRPRPDSGARPIIVPDPETMRRPRYGGTTDPINLIDSNRKGREPDSDARWRSGQPGEER